jgi:hypothetical protein
VSVELRIERLVLTGLPHGHASDTLRADIASALAEMLSADDVARLAASCKPRLPAIDVPPHAAARSRARHIAAAIAEALLANKETAR